jgi:hypothetical protein
MRMAELARPILAIEVQLRPTFFARRGRAGTTKRFASAVAAMLLATICFADSGRDHFSTSQGATILIQPSGASLQVPQNWVLYQTGQEIESVKKGKGEWQTEYAEVLNAALPFTACSLHAGEYRWSSPSVGSLQMRAYVLGSPLDQIQRRILGKGFSAAKHLPAKSIHNASVSETKVGQWHRILIAYDAWYGDYGGKANLEFYLTAQKNWTLVLVFLNGVSGANASEAEQILRSFSWQ